MRILQICPKPPRPAIDGGCLAMDAMTNGFKNNGHEVHILCNSTSKHPFIKNQLENEYILETNFKAFDTDTRVKPFAALIHLLTNKSYNISRFYSKGLESCLKARLIENSYDLVVLESIYTACYITSIRRHSSAKIIMRAHNVEYKIWEDLSSEKLNGISGLLKRWYLGKLATQLKRYEIERLNSFDSILPITEDDLSSFKQLGCTVPMKVVPFGVEVDENFSISINEDFDHVFHFGSMDWGPNIEGVNWLLEEVWGKVRSVNPKAKLVLAGRNMPTKLVSDSSKGIQVLGEVENSGEFLKRPGIMLIPLHSGSGMRVKAIEGMAAGKPTVSTSLGIEGLGISNGEHALISDNPTDFANHITSLLTDNKTAKKIALKGQAHIFKTFSNKRIYENLNEFLGGITK